MMGFKLAHHLNILQVACVGQDLVTLFSKQSVNQSMALLTLQGGGGKERACSKQL